MGFVAPLFLAGLAALGLPWLLHRFSHQDPEQQSFPTTRFLDAVPPPVSQRRTLRYRTLFALRCLLLALLCLVFARPWFADNSDVSSESALQLVVIDRSLSMQVGERMQSASDLADDIINGLGADQPVRVFLADDRFVELTDGQTTPAAAAATLNDVSASDARLDIGVVMRRIDALATESRIPVMAHFVTDAQQSGVPVRRNELLAPALQGLDVVTVDSTEQGNARLSASAASVDGANFRAVVSLQAYGMDDAVSREFVISHDGAELVRDTALLTPGAVVERIFDDVPLPATEAPLIEVSFVEADALPADDSTTVGIADDTTRRVVVAGFNVRVPDTPGVFVRTALQSGADARVEDLAAGANSLPDDARHAVIFADPADEDAMASVLRQTDRGVNVLLVPVPSSAGEEHADSIRVARVDSAHPLALEEISWFGMRHYAYTGFATREGDNDLVVSSAGNPLLVERPVNSGRLLLLNDPLDGQSSNLPFEPAFVELISRAMDWFDAADAVPERATVGEVVSVPARAQLFDPQGDPVGGLSDASATLAVELRETGVYRVLDSRGERYIQVVTDPRESDLAIMTESERVAWVARNDGNAVDSEANDTATALSDTGNDIQTDTSTVRSADIIDRPYWHWLLMAVATLAIIESVLANRRLAVRRDGS